MSSTNWAHLPSVVLYDLYHLLSPKDRLSASSTCKQWREAYFFYPNWRKLQLSTAHSYEEKTQFFLSRALKLCRSLNVTYVAEDFFEVADILTKSTAVCSRMTELQMVGSGEPNTATFPTVFETSVYPFLEKFGALSSLFLYHMPDSSQLYELFEKHKATLRSCGFGSVYESKSPEKTSLPPAINAYFGGMENLQILQLDGCWITSESLYFCSTSLPSLKTLILFLKSGHSVGKITADCWSTFHDALPGCAVHTNYLRMGDDDDSVCKARNITHVRLIYCSREFQENCLNALMRERDLLHELTSIWSISDLSKRELYVRHPFVVCAWRFKHLQEMVLSGAIFDDYDLLGIMRMRPTLRLNIAVDDIVIQENSQTSFRNVNSNDLTKLSEALSLSSRKSRWQPMDGRRFNDPVLPPKDREAAILREVLNADLKC